MVMEFLGFALKRRKPAVVYSKEVEDFVLSIYEEGERTKQKCHPPEVVKRIRLHFDKGVTSKIEEVLTKHGGLLHVLPLAVYLNFSKEVLVFGFCCGALLHG